MTVTEVDREKWMLRRGYTVAHFVDSIVAGSVITICGRRMWSPLEGRPELTEADMTSTQCKMCVRLIARVGL